MIFDQNRYIEKFVPEGRFLILTQYWIPRNFEKLIIKSNIKIFHDLSKILTFDYMVLTETASHRYQHLTPPWLELIKTKDKHNDLFFSNPLRMLLTSMLNLIATL